MFEINDHPTPDELEGVRAPLAAFNAAAAGPQNQVPLAILLRDSDGAVVGGLVGRTFWGWLYVDLLFIPEMRRRAGRGAPINRLASFTSCGLASSNSDSRR